MMLSEDGLGVQREAGDQLFFISMEKRKGRNGLNCSWRDSGRRFQADPLERFILE